MKSGTCNDLVITRREWLRRCATAAPLIMTLVPTNARAQGSWASAPAPTPRNDYQPRYLRNGDVYISPADPTARDLQQWGGVRNE